MCDRQMRKRDVLLAEIQRIKRTFAVTQEIAVRKHYAFRWSGGAGSINEGREILAAPLKQTSHAFSAYTRQSFHRRRLRRILLDAVGLHRDYGFEHRQL